MSHQITNHEKLHITSIHKIPIGKNVVIDLPREIEMITRVYIHFMDEDVKEHINDSSNEVYDLYVDDLNMKDVNVYCLDTNERCFLEPGIYSVHQPRININKKQKYNSIPSPNTYTYNFSLYPEFYQPSRTVTFSRFQNNIINPNPTISFLLEGEHYLDMLAKRRIKCMKRYTKQNIYEDVQNILSEYDDEMKPRNYMNLRLIIAYMDNELREWNESLKAQTIRT